MFLVLCSINQSELNQCVFAMSYRDEIEKGIIKKVIWDYSLGYKKAMKSSSVKQKHELKILIILVTDFPTRR